MKMQIELKEVKSKSVKLKDEVWQDMFTIKLLIDGRLETFETDLKLNLINELERRYDPNLYDYSRLCSVYSRSPKERRF